MALHSARAAAHRRDGCRAPDLQSVVVGGVLEYAAGDRGVATGIDRHERLGVAEQNVARRKPAAAANHDARMHERHNGVSRVPSDGNKS